MQAIKGVIFDYGGTLDSRGEHWSHVIRRGYKAAGVDVSDEDFRKAYVFAERKLATTRLVFPEHNFFDLMQIKVGQELQYLEEKGSLPPGSAERFAQPIARYCYDSARTCVEESRATLDKLRVAGVPMVLVSNFYGNIGAVLADFGIDGYFKTVVESAVVGIRKPDPRIFALGVDALGLPAGQVLVVGDSLAKDIIPAQSLGCATAWFEGPGWDDSSNTPEVSTICIHNLAEIEDVVFQFVNSRYAKLPLI